MPRRCPTWILAFLLPLCAQERGARELYYSLPPGSGARPATTTTPASSKNSRPNLALPPTAPNAGLRIRIELIRDDGRPFWVTPETIFESGDRIRVHIESNTTARLAIFQSQDGTPALLLFPDSRLRHGADTVQSGLDTIIPMQFDDDPGRIRLLFYLHSGSTSHQSTALAATADRIAQDRGLQLDVDRAAEEPALYAVRPAALGGLRSGVAVSLDLEHRRGRGR